MAQHDEVSRAAERFLDRFPSDPRRWDVVAWAVNSPRSSDAAGATTDPVWERRRELLRDEILAAEDAPEGPWVAVAERAINHLAGFRGEPVRDLARAGRMGARLAERVPGSDRRKFAEQTYFAALEAADFGVRINAVSPSIAFHEFLKKTTPMELLEELAAKEAFGRAAEVWEVANVMMFLASDYSGYMTGEIVSVSSQRA